MTVVMLEMNYCKKIKAGKLAFLTKGKIMAFEKKTWIDRIVEHPARRKLTPVSGEENVFDVTRDEGSITAPGDAFNADNMNDLENRIADGLVDFATKADLEEAIGTAINKEY